MISEWVLYIVFFLLAAVFTAFLGYCLYIHHLHQKYDHIPGPPRDSFLLGHSSSLTKAVYSDNNLIHDLFLHWAEKYGPVYRINTLHYVTIMVYCPEATKTIMMSPKYIKDPFVYKQLFNLFGKRFLGNGLITAVDHDMWYRQRRIMDPAFSSTYLRSLISTFDEMSERLMDKLEEMANNKTPAVMHDLVNCVTLDVICKVAFGVDLNLLNQKDSPFQNAVELCLKGMILDVRDPFFRLFPKNWKLIQQVREATELLRKTGEKWIQNRKTAVKNGEDVPKDILTQILKSAEEENVNNTQDLEQMLDNFVTFFIAGQETTANQLSFAIMALGRNPEIYKRAKAEVDEVLGTKREISNEDLGKLTYLSQVLKETLRLYPTAPGTNRWLHEDIVINGIKVPRGCSVMFSSYVSQRLEKFFKDPLKFDPERFDVNAPKPYYCYYPFSLGPRTCLGQVFAQMEAKLVLAKLLQRFEFSLVPGQSFDIKDNGTLRPKSGVICNIKQCS
ncbi:cytochrome P450 46A1.1 [Danio rerio]|uniref:Cholesterol 24-hydroxylase n=1 Tax=Danio rerio TaxID=7955 RepID=Q504G3_DANRE|nr:cytochrome P450 46A1.1 [Danio rerio]AAH95036.1 Cytochrome P450, family 46, subfamily A, polypeptide 1 [Danio rerio]AAI64858.1 Cyp46a1 protein [Danio rerio]|eukprot:NP_001018358.1 cytochrome P450, family 46, subfamily A, polypeptide 1, tandem duplicate 1 [Danio rerio]